MKKKVLFIIWSFSYGGGAEKILANIVNNLDYDKYEIDVLEYLYAGINRERINSQVRLIGPLIDTTKCSFVYKIKNKLIDYCAYNCPKLLRKVCLNKTYDIEISFNYLIPSFLLSENSNKIVSWVHSSIEDINPDVNHYRYWLQKKYWKNVDKIVAISNKTFKSIVELYPEYKDRVVKIYNGYSLSMMETDFVDGEMFDLLYCNRLDNNKNPLFFLEVIHELKKRNVFVKAKLLGSGELIDVLKKKAKEYEIEELVDFKGYIKNPYEYFNNCKLFCLTSYIEGFPTTLIEAMSFGKPFISTPVAGADELSDCGCGYIEVDPASFAEKVILLLSDRDLYDKLKNNCLAEVRRYSLSHQIERIENLIDTLCEK